MKKKVVFQGREYIIELLDNGNIRINGDEYSPQIKHAVKNIYKVEIGGEQFTIELKGEEIIIDGEKVDVQVRPFIKLPQTSRRKKHSRTIKITAPIPGKIAQILVKEGEQVNKDQDIFILEAMKMRNRIMAPKEARLIRINVNEGETVTQDQILAILEEIEK
ncbi:MAG: biotin/lipoyl-containing protein [Candidatus Heimdallarchaeaceae archaeon]